MFYKNCTRNKNAISNHPVCKGKATKAMLHFVDGKNLVTKHTAIQHLRAKAHCIFWKLKGENLKTSVHLLKVLVVYVNHKLQFSWSIYGHTYELVMQPMMPL